MSSDELKKAGLKATAPRMRILRVMESSEQRHLSADEVYRLLIEAGEDVGMATVYRVLTQFEAAGLVHRHHFEEGHSVYELATEEHHDHIVCLQCGKVTEFMDETIESCQRRVAEKAGFRIKDHSLILYGECQIPNCKYR